MTRRLRPLLFIAALLIFSSCRETAIVHDLNERDANEILVVLARHDISATKEKAEKNQEVTWTVNVAEADALTARDILVAKNLPRIREGGLSAICKDSGLILTPKTEKCREILAYKGEIINSLVSIPGVVSADIVLNLPDKEEFPDPNTPQPRPTASVTVQYLDDGSSKTPLTEGKVQQFVANAVTGLDARDVTVIITLSKPVLLKQTAIGDKSLQPATTGGDSSDDDAQTTPNDDTTDETVTEDAAGLVSIGGMEMNETSAKRFKLVAVSFVILLLVIAVAFIIILIRMARLRRRVATPVAGGDEGAEDQKLLGG